MGFLTMRSQENEMIKRLAQLFAVALCMLLATPTANASVIVSVVPAQQTVNIGDTFSVQIIADMSLPIVGWGLDFDVVDDSIVSIVTTPTIGPLWFGVGTPDGDGLAGLAFPNPVSGNGILLATIQLLADEFGETDLLLSYTSGDLTEGFALQQPGQFDSVEFIGGHVTVVPAPGALVAVLVGCGGLITRHGRRRFNCRAA